MALFNMRGNKRRKCNDSPVTVALNDKKMQFSIGNFQHQGRRNYQEDSFGVSDISDVAIERKGLLAVLADGMGGLSNGKEISQRIVSDILAWFNSPQTICENGITMKNVVAELNEKISFLFGNDERMKSGTTLVLALIKNGFLHWLCVGDSRLYVKRNNKLYQVNEDHDYLNRLLGEAIDGNISFSQAFGDSQKDCLVSCIGKQNLEFFDYSKRGFLLKKGDVLLLCSDGVYNTVQHDELLRCITGNPMEDAENIKNVILSRNIPHQDNNTAILIKFN